MEAGPVSGSNARRRGSEISGDGRRRVAERSPTGEGAMHARIFTPEDAEGFSARELAEMNAAYARLSARRERAAGPDTAEHERLCPCRRPAACPEAPGGRRGTSWRGPRPHSRVEWRTRRSWAMSGAEGRRHP